jgi:hypothetical protein
MTQSLVWQFIHNKLDEIFETSTKTEKRDKL